MSFKENAFPIGQGKLNLTSISGVRTDTLVYWCRADGSLTITWADTSTEVVELSKGEAVRIENTAVSVAITTGTFHVA